MWQGLYIEMGVDGEFLVITKTGVIISIANASYYNLQYHK